MMQKIHPAVRVIASLLALEGCVGMTLAGLLVFRWVVLVFVPILWFYILFLVVNRRKMARRIYFLGGVGFMALLGECMQMCFGGFPMFKWLIYIFSRLHGFICFSERCFPWRASLMRIEFAEYRSMKKH